MNAVDRINELRAEAESAIAAAGDSAALEDLRVKYLGRKSELTGILRGIGELPADERGPVGSGANEARVRWRSCSPPGAPSWRATSSTGASRRTPST